LKLITIAKGASLKRAGACERGTTTSDGRRRRFSMPAAGIIRTENL
jgi:hypothetical protein